MANYNVVETTKVSGRCCDFIYDADIENGSVVAKGDIVDGERNIYTAEIPTTGSEVFLVANPAWDYCECRVTNQNEENYINVADKPFRVYQLMKHDKFGVESYGITGGDTVAIGDYVTVDGTTTTLNAVGASEPTLSSTGFVGKVVEIEDYGFAFCTGTAGNVGTTGKRVIIEVVKNATVEA